MDLPSTWHLVCRLRFRQLALVVALGKHSNLHRAAAAVHMAQPSATKVVRDLERLFGFPLFERLPRGMHPTLLGAEVLAFAQRALADLQRFAEDLDYKRQGGNGQLIVGTIPGAAAEHMARATAEIKQRRPLLCVKLMGESSDELIALLLAHKIDLAIGRFVDPLQHNLIKYENLGSEVLCVVARPAHPAARGATFQSLMGYPWILPPLPSPARQTIEQHFSKADVKTPANLIESTSCLTTLQMIQQTDAVSVLPELVIRDYLQAGLLVRFPIALNDSFPNFGILTRRSDSLSPIVTEFADILRRQTSAAGPAKQIQPRKKKDPKGRRAYRNIRTNSTASVDWPAPN